MIFAIRYCIKNKKGGGELAAKGQQIQSEQDVLKDPLVLDFLNVRQDEAYSESDLETAIINNFEKKDTPRKMSNNNKCITASLDV